MVRSLIGDGEGDHVVRKENLKRSLAGNQVDGENLDFILNNTRIVEDSLKVNPDGAGFNAPDDEDDIRGTFSLASAPEDSLIAKYDYQLFTDEELQTFIDGGARFVNSDDPEAVQTGLIDAMKYEAASLALNALATRTAPQFSASAGGKTINKDSVSTKYLALAKEKHELAVEEREAFFERKGARAAPVYQQKGTNQREWTPRR